jgi:hypothetical protein
MKHINYKFSGSSTDFYFAYGISHLKKITDPNATVLITDENVTKLTRKDSGGGHSVTKPGV